MEYIYKQLLEIFGKCDMLCMVLLMYGRRLALPSSFEPEKEGALMLTIGELMAVIGLFISSFSLGYTIGVLNRRYK